MKKSPKYDPQRNEVYAWEAGFTNAATGNMGVKYFYLLLRSACKTYGVTRPTASKLPKKYVGYAAICDVENSTLMFDKTYRTAHVLFHELAHWILIKYGYKKLDHHNPLWLGLFLRLLHEGQVLPMDASVPSARAAGLDFRDPLDCGPINLRKLIAGLPA
jgi:hypothetical protein